MPAAFDPDVFGYQKGSYDPEVFSTGPKPKKMSTRERVENDEISRSARESAAKGGEGFSQGVLNVLAGAVRGAGSIGATIARPFESAEENEARRAGIDANLAAVGAQPDSWMYKGGKVAGEIAGTAGAGGVIAKPLQAVSNLSLRAGAGAIPALDTAATALASGGFQTGAQMGRAADIATRVGAGAVTGGLAAGMVEPNMKSAATGAAIGGVLPAAVKVAGEGLNAVGKSIVGPGVSPEVRQLAERAKQLGIDIPADRIADSRPLNAAAASLNYVPFSGRSATEDLMSEQLNKALSRTFGQDTPNITRALRNADASLGLKFDNFLQRNTVKVDEQFLDDLVEANSRAYAELGTEQAGVISRQVDEIIAKAGAGEIDGQTAYNIKKTLDRIAKRNSPESWYALDLKGKLMDALNRSVGPQAADDFAQLRRQYGNMLSLEKLAKNGADGDINVVKLANMRDINNAELQELADIAAQFVRPREGAHGAAQRVIGAGGIAGAGGGLAAMGVPALPAAAAAAGGAVAAGRMANKALNSEGMRNAVMGAVPGAPVAPAAMGAIPMATQRALPVLGAGAVATEPPAPPPPPATPMQKLGAAQDLDGIITAAGEAVDEALANRPAPAAAPLAAPPPAPVAQVQHEAVRADGVRPIRTWSGRRGDGYASIEDAERALPTRQKMEPHLQWEIEAMPDSTYRLAAYQPAGQMAGAVESDSTLPGVSAAVAGPAPAARMLPSGALMVDGDPQQLRQQLAAMGIASIPTMGGVMVPVRQAQQAMQALQSA